MSGIRRISVSVLLAVGGVIVAFDAVSPLIARGATNGAAHAAASAAAVVLQHDVNGKQAFDRVARDARSAADASARRDGVILTAFTIDATQTVRLTVSKECWSILAVRLAPYLTPLREYERVDASASASAAAVGAGSAGSPVS